MRTRALIAGFGVVVVLAACSGPSEPTPPTPTVTSPVTVSYAHEAELNSYNNNTAVAHATRNAVVLNQVLRGFWAYDPTGSAVPATEFGRFEKVSDSPLTVRYTVAEKAVWSDGTPISCADFVLTWAANSGKWPTGKKDRVTGRALTAFEPAGNPGYNLAKMPQCAAGDRSFTLVYNTPFADWRALFGAGEVLPAHVVEKQTGVRDLVAAVADDERGQITKIADFWNTGWALRPGRYDRALAPSSGPYQVTGWSAGRAVTLTPNPRWWGAPPVARTLVVKIIPVDQQAEALRTGEVQAIDPQPSTELLNQIDAMREQVEVSTHDQFTWEHLDFNFRGAFRSKALRTAFAKCVPRKAIVQNLVTPQNPQAQVLQSRFLLPFQPDYPTLAALGGRQYDEVDVAGAKRILKAEDEVGRAVTIRYQTPNPRRAAEVDLIRDSCTKAGFKVKDGGTSSFFGRELVDGDFDVALYAYQGSALVSQNNGVYDTGGGSNMGKYSDRDVTTWLRQLNVEQDPAEQLRLQQNLDRRLWQDLATIPLFAFPGVLAVSKDVTGVVYNPSANGLTWNAHRWGRT